MALRFPKTGPFLSRVLEARQCPSRTSAISLTRHHCLVPARQLELVRPAKHLLGGGDTCRANPSLGQQVAAGRKGTTSQTHLVPASAPDFLRGSLVAERHKSQQPSPLKHLERH